jgi:L-lysine exporter family protein LysE/ArgO
MFISILKGFTTGGSLIVAIGAQNAFVMRQGLARRHLFVTALLCSCIDALLITLGVFGFGSVVGSHPFVIQVSGYVAALFLFIYGGLAFRSFFRAKNLNTVEEEREVSLKQTILLLLGFSLLNPHVYLDTVLLLGSIALNQAEEARVFFGLGAASASFLWFFGLTYGSFLMAPLLKTPKAWKVIDLIVAFTMWTIGFTLLFRGSH